MNEPRIAAATAQQSDNSVALLMDLVAAAKQGSAAVNRIVAARLAAVGCTVEHYPYRPSRVPVIDEFAAESGAGAQWETCIIGRRAGAGRGRGLILFAHPDTEVFRPDPPWHQDPFVPRLHDGRLYGWGVADDLAGIAMLLDCMAVLQDAGIRPAGDVTLISAPSKRHARGISAALHHGVTADAAVYLHPAESGRGLGEVKAFAPGQLEFRITVSGQLPDTNEPAHTAFAHRAVNPFDKAVAIAAALQAYDARRASTISHPRLQAAIGRSTNLMVSHCAYGDPASLSRLAETAHLGGAVSLIPGEDLDQIKAEVEAAVTAVAHADPWLTAHPPRVEWVAGVSGAETAADSELYRTVDQVIDQATGAPPRVNPLHTSSDIRNPIVQKGIPTVGFGPLCGGLAMAGNADEWVDVGDYVRSLQVTAQLIAAWCGTAGGTDA